MGPCGKELWTSLMAMSRPRMSRRSRPVKMTRWRSTTKRGNSRGSTRTVCFALRLMSASVSKHSSCQDFYKTFWSVQLPFSRPPIFATPGAFNDFKQAVEKVLPVIKEATTKERVMMGNRALAGHHPGPLKRKRDAESGEETSTSDYFFAKFLTSPDLLSIEVRRFISRRPLAVHMLIHLDCGHAFQTSNSIPTSYSPQPPAIVHEVDQGCVGNSA